MERRGKSEHNGSESHDRVLARDVVYAQNASVYWQLPPPMVKKSSPNRRRSIAVPNQKNRPSLVPKARRRAHSIVPGAALSPLAKARRSLVRI